MFEHPHFDIYPFESIPLNTDCYLMDEIYREEYENYMLRVISEGSQENPIGYISYAAVRKIDGSTMELSWYPNIFDRFHEVRVTLAKADFVACVGSWRWSEKPHIFVKTEWLNNLHLRSYSVFGFIDAIGVKKALREGTITRDRLIKLRDGIDRLGKSYPQVSFISFADSVLVKSNWSVGQVNSTVRYTYQPEVFLGIVKAFQQIFIETLELGVYAVFTQGHNEYYADSLLHISASQNHVCLNSLGLPFSQLLAIDEAAKANIRDGVHPPLDLYMDAHFFHSLRFKFEFKKEDHIGNYQYNDKMSDTQSYYCAAQLKEIADNLDLQSSKKPS